MTLQDALVAYRTYARAEGKSPKTVDWVVSSVGYFADFLSPAQQDIGKITGNDLRRFIIALWDKLKFANHPYNKPQQAKLSAQSIETYCRESLAIEVTWCLGGHGVVATLMRLAEEKGLPKSVRIDNGPEFTSKVLDQRAYLNGVELDFIHPDKPTDNALIGACNGRFREECPNESWFLSMEDARER